MEYALYYLAAGVSISNALTSIGVGAVLLVWAFKKTVLQEKASTARPLVILASLLFLTYAISLIHSEYLRQSIFALFFKYGKYLFLMVAIGDGIKDKRIAINIAIVLCSVATFMCWDGFYQFFSGRDFLLSREAGHLDIFFENWQFHTYRISGTFPSANTFASYLVPVLMLALALSFFYRVKTRRVTWVKVVFLASILVGLFLTFSRGGLVACTGGVLILIILFKKKILWAIPVALFVVFLFGHHLYGNRAAQKGEIDPTVQTRLSMLKEATSLFRSHPWTGIGLNTYIKKIEKTTLPGEDPDYAHNSYIQILAEVGIVGFMSFMALVFYWFWLGLRSFRNSFDPELKSLQGGVLAGVLGLCVASFFDNVLFELLPATLFWILMGYGVAITNLERAHTC